MEKSAKKELFIYSFILVMLVVVVVVKNFILPKTDNNIAENTVNQTNEQYLTVNNTTYNTMYQEEWMGEV